MPEYNLHAAGRHFLELIPPAEKKKASQKRCSVCFKNCTHKESRYQHKNCIFKPGLYQK